MKVFNVFTHALALIRVGDAEQRRFKLGLPVTFLRKGTSEAVIIEELEVNDEGNVIHLYAGTETSALNADDFEIVGRA